jgi:hypothetical protein
MQHHQNTLHSTNLTLSKETNVFEVKDWLMQGRSDIRKFYK